MRHDVHSHHDDYSKGSIDRGVASSNQPVHRYESDIFGSDASPNQEIMKLFYFLQTIQPMEKYGPMSGNCDQQTTQMEDFLRQTFGFKNRQGEYIVQGVQSFQIGKPVEKMNRSDEISFPCKTKKSTIDSFRMSVEEIQRWQQSYKVYADGSKTDITGEFLRRALQGHSQYGPEAFLMKFVIRISQCPILMEFDGRVINRNLQEKWPENIRLVSVTGVDFAGRIHDLDDTRTYLVNWRDIYEIDPRNNLPYVDHGRDFCVKRNAPRGQLDESRLTNDLMRMARLRLTACDREKIQIVVETGIGLGVFAGKYIGIDDQVRSLSAFAIRKVLEEDGPNYRYIRGVVFALPIFDGDTRNGRREDTYYAFKKEFQAAQYKGRIPVLIADQDMHRLTVAIARQKFQVSELNPADSHGVFGEYWQNRGPAVEEKLALTTVGLLVQHHLINPYVLDPSHYCLI